MNHRTGCLLLLLAACAGPGPASQVGSPAPASDAGEPDAGPAPTDAGAPDAGAPDAGVDAGPPCLPYPDAGGVASIGVVIDGGEFTSGYPLVDVPLEIQLRGFTPCTEVSVEFGLDNDAGLRSWATFAVPPNGQVSTATDAPKAGTWRGVDVDGPLWSMDGPAVAMVDFDLKIRAEDTAGRSAQRVVGRTFTPDGVTVSQVHTLGVVGELYQPHGPGPFPAVVAFGGSEGGLSGGRLMARTLVAEGVGVLAVAYFGATGVPASLDEIPLEYFHSAVQVLQSKSWVRSDRIGVVGASRGGEAALLVGAHYPADVAAVVAVVPSGYVWPAWDVWTESSWTFGGAPVPFVPWANAPPRSEFTDGGLELLYQRAQFEASLAAASPAQLSQASIAVEQASGPVLLLAAEEDGVWPSCPMASEAYARMVDAGHTAAQPLDDYVCYPGAGHALNPGLVGLPLVPAMLEPISAQQAYATGGSAQASAHASRQALERIRAVLDYLKR